MQSQVKLTNHCMTANLTGKSKVSKVSSVSQSFLNRFNNTCQQESLYDTVTGFLGFTALFYYQEPDTTISLSARGQQN